jgi:hypothetical protein
MLTVPWPSDQGPTDALSPSWAATPAPSTVRRSMPRWPPRPRLHFGPGGPILEPQPESLRAGRAVTRTWEDARAVPVKPAAGVFGTSFDATGSLSVSSASG